jgi:hypothetical protein
MVRAHQLPERQFQGGPGQNPAWHTPKPFSAKGIEAEASLTAEAVEKANPLDQFTPDFCLHQPTQK